MKAEVSLADRTNGLGAVKNDYEKPCQQLYHRELVGVHHMKYM